MLVCIYVNISQNAVLIKWRGNCLWNIRVRIPQSEKRDVPQVSTGQKNKETIGKNPSPSWTNERQIITMPPLKIPFTLQRVVIDSWSGNRCFGLGFPSVNWKKVMRKFRMLKVRKLKLKKRKTLVRYRKER